MLNSISVIQSFFQLAFSKGYRLFYSYNYLIRYTYIGTYLLSMRFFNRYLSLSIVVLYINLLYIYIIK